MDIMIDTNIIISAAIFPNDRINRFIKAVSTEHQLFLCSYSLDEAEVVIRRKFPHQLREVEVFLYNLGYTLARTPSVDILSPKIAIRDETDYPILASAIVADVDVLITGDKDFTGLNIERPKIMTITKFIDKYLRGGK